MTCPLCQEKLQTKVAKTARRRVAKRCPRCAFHIFHQEGEPAR